MPAVCKVLLYNGHEMKQLFVSSYRYHNKILWWKLNFLFRDLPVVLNVENTFLISWSLKNASGSEGGVEGRKLKELRR